MSVNPSLPAVVVVGSEPQETSLPAVTQDHKLRSIIFDEDSFDLTVDDLGELRLSK
jgi:hypothetical protein